MRGDSKQLAELGEHSDTVWDLSDWREAQVAVETMVTVKHTHRKRGCGVVRMATDRRVRLVALRTAAGNSCSVLFIMYLVGRESGGESVRVQSEDEEQTGT